MKKIFIEEVTNKTIDFLDNEQVIKLKEILDVLCTNYEIIKIEESIENSKIIKGNEEILNQFLSAKEIEGCSNRTLKYYKDTINKIIININKPIDEITTVILRNYLSQYKEKSSVSTVSIDNVRRVMSSFFTWLENEDYITKSPVRRIHKVKIAKKVKETFTDENLENLRNNCKNIRDLAILEVLISTGMRVGELVKLNRSDINFNERSCIVLGKGNAEREVYFNAKSKIYIEKYLESRIDDKELWQQWQ